MNVDINRPRKKANRQILICLCYPYKDEIFYYLMNYAFILGLAVRPFIHLFQFSAHLAVFAMIRRLDFLLFYANVAHFVCAFLK